MSVTGILIVGVGGQGTLMASKVLGEVGLRSGFDVKVSEVHGMAQRGGSVVTHVKIGERVHSPLVGQGQADYILAFEELEALRWASYLKKNGNLIVSSQRILPMPVAQGNQGYPTQIRDVLRQAATTHLLEASEIARCCGNARATNMVLLGVLASKLGMKEDVWREVIEQIVPKSTVETNLRAFEEGYKIIAK
jgi:indolepyruvate ferredoxin oxidoreductase beta subunit